MQPIRRASALIAAWMICLGGPAASWAEGTDKSVVDEILNVLHERGDLDQADYERLVSKNAEHEKKQSASWTSRIAISGDLRARYEGFFFHPDQIADLENRHRGRYRARIGVAATINDYATAVVRVASGEGDLRSTNRSFGRSGPDFDPDDIYIDLAYAQLRNRDGQIPVVGGIATLQAGKVPNPFLWKIGKDSLLFDNDITPEGVSVAYAVSPWQGIRLFSNAGFFVLDENFSTTGVNKDPKLIGLQLGTEFTPSSPFAFGFKSSWYGFRSLDASFVSRGVNGAGSVTQSAGNLVDGLTGDATGGSMDVGALDAYGSWRGIDDWPVTLYGSLARNFDAESSRLYPRAGRNGDAWMVGFELGDKARWLKLGSGFVHVEANAFPSMLIDSDLVDGTTNREGWLFYGSRQLFSNTDLNVALFSSDGIEDQLPAFQHTLSGSKRLRAQIDLDMKF